METKTLKPWNINRVITKVNTQFGAPMGRFNKGNRPKGKVYNKRVPMNGAYDKGGVYWGVGSELRVEFSASLEYIKFYRVA